MSPCHTADAEDEQESMVSWSSFFDWETIRFQEIRQGRVANVGKKKEKKQVQGSIWQGWFSGYIKSFLFFSVDVIWHFWEVQWQFAKQRNKQKTQKAQNKGNNEGDYLLFFGWCSKSRRNVQLRKMQSKDTNRAAKADPIREMDWTPMAGLRVDFQGSTGRNLQGIKRKWKRDGKP